MRWKLSFDERVQASMQPMALHGAVTEAGCVPVESPIAVITDFQTVAPLAVLHAAMAKSSSTGISLSASLSNMEPMGPADGAICASHGKVAEQSAIRLWTAKKPSRHAFPLHWA